MDLGRSWAPFGRGLGRSGASFAHSWALLGRFGEVRDRAFIEHWSKIGSKRPSGSILGGSWRGSGLGEDLGGSWDDFSQFCDGFWRDLGRFSTCLKILVPAAADSLNGPPR